MGHLPRILAPRAMDSMKKLLLDARQGGYAVCYCEAWSLESFQAVVEAAEEERSPIIAGFNGGFLMHPGRKCAENLKFYAGLGLTLEKARVPAALLLNESKSLDQIAEAIDLGFNAVMVENEGFAPDEYRHLVKKVVRKAHPSGVSVEAQVGHLADASSEKTHAEPTTPADARAFVEETEIDALGIAVGNVHILTKGHKPLDLATLKEIGAAVPVPLVLHGGTGIRLDDAVRSVQLGVAKVNYGTGLKQAYLAALKEKLAAYQVPMSPHPFIGMGGESDVLVAGREAVKAKCQELLRAWGSSGKAEN
jgi:ketose-bisphosphate aldolase